MKEIEKILRLAKTEAEWMRYYGHESSRKEERFEDIGFYDRMLPIGYSKVYTPLSHKCPMGFVDSLDPDSARVVSGPRDHSRGIYTPLELVVHNRMREMNEMIAMIKEISS
jgi:hypothetical protein